MEGAAGYANAVADVQYPRGTRVVIGRQGNDGPGKLMAANVWKRWRVARPHFARGQDRVCVAVRGRIYPDEDIIGRRNDRERHAAVNVSAVEGFQELSFHARGQRCE